MTVMMTVTPNSWNRNSDATTKAGNSQQLIVLRACTAAKIPVERRLTDDAARSA